MRLRPPLLWLLGCALAAAPGPGGPCLAAGVEAITRPSEDVTLSFVMRGQVGKLLVKEGDVIQAGEVLVIQDDEAERLQLEQLKAQAEDNTRVGAEEARCAQKQVDLRRKEEVYKKGAATGLELDTARLEATLATALLALARFEHTQNQMKYDEAKVQHDRMQLKSPIGGRVEQLFVKVGEGVDALQKVARVVKTDPLWIDVPVPLGQARSVKLGQEAQVEFPLGAWGQGGRDKPAASGAAASVAASGRVIHVAAVADAASDTLTVRVELVNPGGRPAGEHVLVSFSTSDGGAAVPQKSAETPKPEDSQRKD